MDYEAFREEIDNIADARVRQYGVRGKFEDVLNISINEVARAIAEVKARSHTILSVEQSNKTMIAVAIMVTARIMREAGRPRVVMDVKSSIKELCANKVNIALNNISSDVDDIDSEAIHPKSKKQIETIARKTARFDKFKTGQSVLIMQPNASNLETFHKKFVVEKGLRDCVFIIDEADAVWSSVISLRAAVDEQQDDQARAVDVQDPRGRRCGRQGTPHVLQQRRAHRLPHLRDAGPHARVALCVARPAIGHVVDKRLLKSRGFATYEEIVPPD
jgi:hypothetical protein